MILQVAQGGSKAFTASEEVFVDAQDLRTGGRVEFGELAAQTVLKVALDGSGTDAFALSQAAAVNAVQVLLIAAC